jgi:ribosome-associated protein
VDLRVNGWLVIPDAELSERFSRSSGPGGQSVNTADSRVELSFDIAHSAALPEWARARAAERLAGRLSGGVLTVAASEQRSQLANRQAARERLAALLRAAIAPPARPRIPTRPTRGSNERRLNAKRNRGDIKQSRSRRFDQDGLQGYGVTGLQGYKAGRLTTTASWVERAMTTTASVSGEGFSSRCGTCGGTQT